MRELNGTIVFLTLVSAAIQVLGLVILQDRTGIWYVLVLLSVGHLILVVASLVLASRLRFPPRKQPNQIPWITAVLLASWIVVPFFGEAQAYYWPFFLISVLFLQSLLLTTTTMTTVLVGANALAYGLLWALRGQSDLAWQTGFLSVGFLVTAYVLRRVLMQWIAQMVTYQQSQWAIQHLAKTSERLQSDLSLSEIKTRLSERARIAREIHDTVGHSLTTILIQLRVASALHGDLSHELSQKLTDLEGQVMETIQDVRNKVHEIRNELVDLQSWETKFATLARVFEETTQVRVRVNIEEAVSIEDDSLGENLYSILKESLTNSYRHGQARMVDLAIGVSLGRLLIRISDDGRGDTVLTPGSGLKGMKERVEKMNGTIVWQTMEGKGFDIGIDIPLPSRVLA